MNRFAFVLLVPAIIASPLGLEGNDKYTKPTPVMIAEEGYPTETHWVTTQDGYILQMHRIPGGKNGERNGKVAFLQHGLLVSSADWIIQGPGKSLGYILADEGYDVWMGNARGNVYSKNHTKYNPVKNGEFWQFSWNEIGIYDLPAMIDYVLNNTGAASLYYAGHSQGTTSFYVMASEKPEYNKKIKVHASLAPIAYMGHITSPMIRLMAQWEGTMEMLLHLLGVNEFLPEAGFIHKIMEDVCDSNVGGVLCDNVLFALCGFSIPEMNLTTVPVIMGHTPAGASTKQLLHYGQEVRSGKFRKYDYGLIKNMEKYGKIYPPTYDLKKVTAPVFLFYSDNDWMAGCKDVDRLYEELGNPIGKQRIAEGTFNHLDFMYGIHADRLVYHSVANLFRNC